MKTLSTPSLVPKISILLLLAMSAGSCLRAENQNPCLTPIGEPPGVNDCPVWDEVACEWIEADPPPCPHPPSGPVEEGYYWDVCACEWVEQEEGGGGGEPPEGVTTNRPAPQLSTGSKFRKISLTGRPLPDQSPQNEEESDSLNEETYIDAFNLSLNHSTTDIYIPISGSDIALSARRDITEDSWEFYSLKRVFPLNQQPGKPFGYGWHTNLVPHLKFTSRTSDSSRSIAGSGVNYVYVTDEQGSSHRFINNGAIFVPYPTTNASEGSYFTSLKTGTLPDGSSGYIFTKKFGTRLYFTQSATQDMSRLWNTSGYDSEDASGSTTHIASEQYHRCLSVIDKNGSGLSYEYNSNGYIIPDRIRVIHNSSSTNQYIQIIHNNNTISQISDPTGTIYKYTYSTSSAGFPLLQKATKAFGTEHATETSYGYFETTETETALPNCYYSVFSNYSPLIPAYPKATHVVVNEIADDQGNEYRFNYTVDTSLQRYFMRFIEGASDCPDYNGYITSIGQPLNVSMVRFYDSGKNHETVISQFSKDGILKSADTATESSITGQITVKAVDINGNGTQYFYTNPQLLIVNDATVEVKDPDSEIRSLDAPQLLMFFSSISVSNFRNVSGDAFGEKIGSSYIGFDLFRSMAPTVSKDFNGNITRFTYTDPISTAVLSTNVNENLHFSPYHSDPNTKTDANGNTTHYTYTPNTRIQQSVLDPEGRFTWFDIDSLGRRTQKRVFASKADFDNNNPPVSKTGWEYHPTYKGVVTKETEYQLDPTLTAYAPSTVTSYTVYGASETGGNAGNIKTMTVDPTPALPSSGDEMITSYTYDLNNNKTSVTDPRGHTTYFVYDSLNRITDIVYPPATGSGDSTAPRKQLFYDSRSNKIKEIDENGIATLYAYDGRNRKITQARDMNGNELIDSGDLIMRFEYNGVGSLVKTTSPEGTITRNEYDALQRLVRTKTLKSENPNLADDVITDFFYDDILGWGKANCGSGLFTGESFKPTMTIDPRGYATIIQYDNLYRPIKTHTQYKNPNASSVNLTDYATTENTYNKVGNLTHVKDPLGVITKTDYDALNRPYRVTAALGTPDEAISEKFYTSNGLPWKTIDPLGRETTTHFDGAGRPVEVHQPAVPDAADGGIAKRPITKTFYDASSNVIATVNPLLQRWDFTFDERNRQILEEQPAVEYVDEAGNFVTTPARPTIATTYDAVGNVTSVTDARGFTSSTVYDAANRPVFTIAPAVNILDDSDALITAHPVARTVFDANGNVLETIQATLAATAAGDPAPTTHTSASLLADANYTEVRTTVINTYDALNRLLSSINPMDPADSTDDIVVRNEYDPSSNRIKVIDGKDQVTTFGYDGLSRNTTTTYGVGTGFSNTTTLAYDAVNMTSRTDPDGRLTTYTYDHQHRLDTVDYANDAIIDRDYTYDLIGNILTVDEPGLAADVAYTYDALNRIETETSNGVTHEYDYDLAGNRLKTTYGVGLVDERVMTSTYDALNRTVDIVEDGRTSTYRYDIAGSIRQKIQPNGHTILRSYDPLGRTQEVFGPDVSGDYLYTQAYTYDLYANLRKLAEVYPGGQIEDRMIWNTYDPADRLSVELVDYAAQADVTTSYQYDKANNRLAKEVFSSLIATRTKYSYNPKNQLVFYYTDADLDGILGFEEEHWSLQYNKSGARTLVWYNPNQYSWGDQKEYFYDYENRLISLHEADANFAYSNWFNYTYDYRTRRVTRDESGAGGALTHIVFAGGTSAREYTESGTTAGFQPAQDILDVEYIRGSDYGGGVGGILYTLRDDGLTGAAPIYKHYNSRGDVIANTDASGSLTYLAGYEAFGKHGDSVSSQEWGTNPDRQQANTKDEDPTGLLNEGFRYRDLETGTFLTRDPLGFVDGPNVYTYVVQNPWTYYDPLGLRMEVEGKYEEDEDGNRHYEDEDKQKAWDTHQNVKKSDYYEGSAYQQMEESEKIYYIETTDEGPSYYDVENEKIVINTSPRADHSRDHYNAETGQWENSEMSLESVLVHEVRHAYDYANSSPEEMDKLRNFFNQSKEDIAKYPNQLEHRAVDEANLYRNSVGEQTRDRYGDREDNMAYFHDRDDRSYSQEFVRWQKNFNQTPAALTHGDWGRFSTGSYKKGEWPEK